MGVTLGDFASHDGHFAIIVESLWVYKGPFSKNIHFPNRFKWFDATLMSTWGHFGSTLALLWVYEGDFGSLLGHFGTTLTPLWAYDAYMCR